MRPSNFARYFEAAVTRAVDELAADTVTARSLSRAAFRLGSLLHLDGVTEEARTAAADALVAVALRRSNCTAEEARQCVARAMREGASKPYSPKPRQPSPSETRTAAPALRFEESRPGATFAASPARPPGASLEEQLGHLAEQLGAVLAYVRQGGR